MQQRLLTVSLRRALVLVAATACACDAASVFAQQAVPGADDQTAQTAQSTPAEAAATKPKATVAVADEPKTTELEGITVTGQLAAIRRAQAIKQDSINVVDSVSAEEAGKFPDQNVADALQRVPGVSVNRSGGESSQIAIRGFGPDFVAVTLNGRQMATASGSRAFNFDVLPSEIISVAQVNKTSSADISEVDIGGVVDIQTARPFDFHGFHGAGSIAGVNSTLTGDWSSDTTPKGSGVVGWTNDDSTFGWLASAMYYKRKDTKISTEGYSWYAHQNISRLSGLSDPTFTDVAMPETLGNNISEETRTRQSFSGAIDWRPFEALTIKFDTLYANYEVASKAFTFGEYGNTSDIQSLTVDSHGTPLKFVRKSTGGLANDYVMASYPTNEKTLQNGLNIGFDLTDTTKLSVDISNAQAWNKAGKDGYFFVVGTRNIGVNPTWTNNGSDRPPSYTNILSTTDLSNLAVHCCTFGQGNNVTNKIDQYQVALSKSFTDGTLSKLEAGFQATNQFVKSVTWSTPDGILCNAYCGYNVTAPASALGAYIYTPPAPVNGVSQPGLPSKWIMYDPYAYANWLTTPAAYNQLPADKRAALLAALAANGGSFKSRANPGSFNNVTEDNKSVYLKAVFENTAWGMPWVLDVGVRHLDVSSRSNAIFRAPISYYIDPNDTSAGQVAFGPLQPQSAAGGYDKWLPSLNFKLKVRDDLIYRLALSETLTPPQLSNLYFNRSFGTRPDSRTINQGNPELQPYTSKNFDTGLEWYIDDASYVALQLFYKKVSNFSTIVSTPTQFLGYTWSLTQPINLNSANIYGQEFTFNYQFANLLPSPFDGLGVALNYTHVKSSAGIRPGIISTTGTFAVPGIGDSANLSGYYEKGPWQVRLAYNWRGEYLQSISYGSGAQPATRTAFGQVDLTASYQLTDHISLFASGTNLTREHLYDYSVYPNRFLYAEADGSEYTIGVRGTF